MTNNQLLNYLAPALTWSEIEAADYVKYGILCDEDISPIAAYLTNKIAAKSNMCVYYQYITEEDLEQAYMPNIMPADHIKDTLTEYNEIRSDIYLQQQSGLVPLTIEMLDNNTLFTVSKILALPKVYSVDYFFVIDQKLYSFHTFVKIDCEQFSYDYLKVSYPHIKYAVDQILKIYE